MMFRALSATALAATFLFHASRASAAEAINYTELFRTKAIKCVHGTANPDKATVEILKGPELLAKSPRSGSRHIMKA